MVARFDAVVGTCDWEFGREEALSVDVTGGTGAIVGVDPCRSCDGGPSSGPSSSSSEPFPACAFLFSNISLLLARARSRAVFQLFFGGSGAAELEATGAGSVVAAVDSPPTCVNPTGAAGLLSVGFDRFWLVAALRHAAEGSGRSCVLNVEAEELDGIFAFDSSTGGRLNLFCGCWCLLALLAVLEPNVLLAVLCGVTIEEPVGLYGVDPVMFLFAVISCEAAESACLLADTLEAGVGVTGTWLVGVALDCDARTVDADDGVDLVPEIAGVAGAF